MRWTPESFGKKVPGKGITGHHALITSPRILAFSGRIEEVIAPFAEEEIRQLWRRSSGLIDAPL